MAQRMNPMAYQADLAKVLDAGKGSIVIGGELSRHGYLTKAKTEEEALKEMQDNKLSQKPITGFQFNVKDARVISGDGIGTIMEQIIVSGFKPNKDNSATFVECRCGHRMPKLYATENGQIVDISKEFEGKPVSYQVDQLRSSIMTAFWHDRLFLRLLVQRYEEFLYLPNFCL